MRNRSKDRLSVRERVEDIANSNKLDQETQAHDFIKIKSDWRVGQMTDGAKLSSAEAITNLNVMKGRR